MQYLIFTYFSILTRKFYQQGLFSIHLGPAPVSRQDVGKYCITVQKKYQKKVAVQHDKTTYQCPAGMPKGKSKQALVSVGSCTRWQMYPVISRERRMSSGRVQWAVLCLWESAAPGAAAVPVKLCCLKHFYIELLLINSKENSCCCVFHRKDTTKASYDKFMADRGLGDPSESQQGRAGLPWPCWDHPSSLPCQGESASSAVSWLTILISSGGMQEVFDGGPWSHPWVSPKGVAEGLDPWVGCDFS